MQGSLRVTDTTYTNDLNLASATASKAVLTNDSKNLVTGTVPVNTGGTGQTSWTKGGILYASATNTLAQVADGSANKVLRATASATYDWLAYTSTDTANTLVYRDANRGFSSGTISISKAGETGVEVNNTQETNPNQVAFIVGSSGNGGIYSRKHTKWIVYADPSGNVTLNGNANTATKLATARNLGVALGSATAVTFDGSANQTSIPVSGTLLVGNGGTSATTAAGARANLGTWALVSDSYNTLMPADGTTNGWIKIGKSNTSYGILPSAAGAAGSGHNYIGTSTWYWKYAYIDEIHGSLYGGSLYLNNKGNNSIYNGPNDAANIVGGALGNLVIDSWYGLSITTSCANQTYTGTNAISINCRNGNTYIGGSLTVNSDIESDAGIMQKVTLLPAVSWANVTADTWYRCCKIKNKIASHYLNGMIQLTGIYNTGQPTMATISIQTMNTTASLHLLHCNTVGNIKSIRLVNTGDNTSFWLDVLINKQSSGTMGSATAMFIGSFVVSDVNVSLTTASGTATTQLDLVPITSTMWYMLDTKWIRSYNKPVLIDIGSDNAYGINGHRLGLGISGASHSSIMLKGGDVMYGFGVNNNGNWYFGKRTSQSFESTSGDSYSYYGNDTLIVPNATNSVALGDATHRWKSFHTYSISSVGTVYGGGIFQSEGAGDHYFEAKNTTTGSSVLLDAGSSTTHGIYSRGYSPTATTFTADAKWMIYRDSTGTITVNGNAATASKLADSAHNWTATEVYNYMTARVLKAGDTMTGSLTVSGGYIYCTKSGDSYVDSKSTTSSCRILLYAGGNGSHGLYSTGYWNGSAYTAGGKWLIYRSVNNTTVIGDSLWVSGNVYAGSSGTGSVYCNSIYSSGALYHYTSGATGWGFFSNSTTESIVGTYWTSTYNIYLYAKGEVGLYAIKSGKICYVNTSGAITVRYNTLTNLSSIRVKENIRPMSDGEALQILNINPVFFNYKKGYGSQDTTVGVIAEQVEPYIKYVVNDDEDPHDPNLILKGVSYDKLIPYLIKLAQIQQREINNLKQQIQNITETNSQN